MPNEVTREKVCFISPECMPAHRRARRTLEQLERREKGYTSYSVWIAPREDNFIDYMRSLHYIQVSNCDGKKDKRKQALETVFHFRIPTLGHALIWDLIEESSEQVSQWKDYWQPYFIEAILPKEDGWVCYNVLEFAGHNGTNSRERCNEFNPKTSKICLSCYADMPSMRPFFFHLQYTIPLLALERMEFLRKIKQLDAELMQYEAAIEKVAGATNSDDRREVGSARFAPKPAMNELIAEPSDSNKVTFTLNNQILDLNLIQEGVWQRIETSAVLPLLLANKSRVTARLLATWAKLCLLVQYTYELAVPFIQRVVRGHMTRLHRLRFEHEQTARVELKASIRLQQAIRRLLSSCQFESLMQIRRHTMCIKIQSFARRKISIIFYNQILENFCSCQRDTAVTLLQKIVRSHNAVKIGDAFKFELVKQKEDYRRLEEVRHRNKNASVIQMMYRAVVARDCLRQKRVEEQLHGQLAMHLKTCLSQGNLWSFLLEVNNDYRRYERIIDTILEREGTMASTFISKVIAIREEEQRQVWQDFNIAKQNESSRRGYPRDSALRHSTRPSFMSRNPYSPKKKKPMKKLVVCQNPASLKYRQAHTNSHIENAANESRHHLPAQRKTPPIEQIGVAFGDQMSDNYHPVETVTNGRIHQEIPNGINDTILVLFRAASLRCILPRFLPSGLRFNNADDAFAYYLSLTSTCPEKICFEKEAWDYAEPFAHQLMIRFNTVYVRDLLPESKMASLLQVLDPRPLSIFLISCESIIRSLCCYQTRTKILLGPKYAKKLKEANIQHPNANDIYQFASLAHISSYDDCVGEEHLDNSGLWGNIVLASEQGEEFPVKKHDSPRRKKDNYKRNWAAALAVKKIQEACIAHPVYGQCRPSSALGIDNEPLTKDVSNQSSTVSIDRR